MLPQRQAVIRCAEVCTLGPDGLRQDYPVARMSRANQKGNTACKNCFINRPCIPKEL